MKRWRSAFYVVYYKGGRGSLNFFFTTVESKSSAFMHCGGIHMSFLENMSVMEFELLLIGLLVSVFMLGFTIGLNIGSKSKNDRRA